MSETGQVEKCGWRPGWSQAILHFPLTIREKQHKDGDKWELTFTLIVQGPHGSVKAVAPEAPHGQRLCGGSRRPQLPPTAAMSKRRPRICCQILFFKRSQNLDFYVKSHFSMLASKLLKEKRKNYIYM